jgi:hypothetical protein
MSISGRPWSKHDMNCICLILCMPLQKAMQFCPMAAADCRFRISVIVRQLG